MRKFVALLAVVAIALLAACSNKPAAVTDPYQVLDAATSASYGDLVQVNVGFDFTGSQDVHVSPNALRLIVDTKSGKADVALSLPLADLGIDAATRTTLGLTGDTLDLDVRFDGTAVYTKSPLLQPMLTALMAQTGGTPGDYSGWVQIGTAEELAALAASLAPQASFGPLGSVTPAASHDAASLKRDMEEGGVTLTYVGREQRGGVDADHLTVALDVDKFRNSDMAAELPAAQMTQIEVAFTQADITADLWVAADSHKVTEIDATVTGKATAGASADFSAGDKVSFAVLFSEPSDASALQAPADYTELPLAPMIQTLLQSFGPGLFTGA